MPNPPTSGGRRSNEVDLGVFMSVVEEAIDGFGSDVSYAVSMSRAAAAIERKREVWNVRLELRAARADAVAECREAIPFPCRAKSPCGTGDCRFARGEFKEVYAPDCEGKEYRPQWDSTNRYNLEAALGPLRALRDTEK